MSVMNGGIMTFNPASPGTPVGYDSYAWADRPAAASYIGRVIRVTDVGPAAGSLFISDGTYWVPLNGHVTLAAEAELGLFTTSSSLGELAGWSLTIPAGLFQKPGSFLRGIIKGRRTGTLGNSGFPTIKIGWSTNGGHAIAGASAGQLSTNDAMRCIGAVSRVNDTQVRSTEAAGNHGNLGLGTDSYESNLQTLSATVDQTLHAYGNVDGTPGLNETTWVDEIIVELITP